MGLLNNFFGKKAEGAEQPKQSSAKPEKAVPEKKPAQQKQQIPAPEGKYDETCSLCGQGGTDKKWAGQYWHKKCLRKGKKLAKGMI